MISSKKRENKGEPDICGQLEEMSLGDKLPPTQVNQTTSKKAQASLAAFFGGNTKPVEGSKIVKRGSEPEFDDFQDGKIDIWSWNVNGANAVLDKGIL